MLRLSLAVSVMAVGLTHAALPPRVAEEREAIRQRWLDSRARAPERYARACRAVTGEVERLLAARNQDGPRAGVWGSASEWHFRQTGENALVLAVAASLPDSPHVRDERLVTVVTQTLDYLARTDRDGCWHTDDTNVSRFCLAPAAEAFLVLSDRLPPNRFPDWVAMFRRAGAYQITTYLPRTAFGNGLYPNMDAFFVLSTALCAVICDEPEWLTACEGVTRRLQEFCLLADGAYEYVDDWNPVPVYQDIVPVILGRYWLLTGDRVAEEQLRATVEYYPWYSEVSGACDNGMTPFIKHYWGYDGRMAAPEFTSFLTGDGRNTSVADRRAHWLQGGYWSALMLQWISDAEPAPLPTDFVRRAPGVDGFQMRSHARFTAWLTGRATAHDTLLSVVASDPGAVPLRRQALAGFLTEVEGRPELSPTGAMARLIFTDAEVENPGLRHEQRVAVPADTEQIDTTLMVPDGVRVVRCDLFMFFRPGTVTWDNVSLLVPDGQELLPNVGFEQDELDRPAGWNRSAYGTDGEMTYLRTGPFAGAAVSCRAPSDKDRAGWIATVPVPGGGRYRFRARARMQDVTPPSMLPPLVYYLTDMSPEKTQAFGPGLAVQRVASGLHAMGHGVRYPTPVDGRWRWNCWTGGSLETAPWQVAQTWILTPGRVFGMLDLRCVTDGDGQSVRFRPVLYPDTGLSLTRTQQGAVLRVPRIGMQLWTGPGLVLDLDQDTDSDRLWIAGPEGPWLRGQRLTLNVAIGPDFPPPPDDWGFFAPAEGLRGWWQRSDEGLHLVVVNEGDSTFRGDLPLPFARFPTLDRALSGPAFTVTDGTIHDLALPPGRLIAALLEEP